MDSSPYPRHQRSQQANQCSKQEERKGEETGSERRMGQLVDKAQRQLGVFVHVAEAEVLDLVVGRVDLLVGVFHLTLSRHGGWETLPAGRGVVRTGIAALGFDERNIAVLVFVSAKAL